MATITHDEAEAYLARWRLVHEAEANELRRTSMDTKLRQLAALMAARDLFADDPNRDHEVGIVRERWAHLRRVLNG